MINLEITPEQANELRWHCSSILNMILSSFLCLGYNLLGVSFRCLISSCIPNSRLCEEENEEE